MAGTTSIKQVEKGKARAALRELIIAWAHDADTNSATYILELGPDRSGAKSRCLCPGCGSPLIAVNNAKIQRKVRPHFRHQQGVNSKNCSIVAARLALLRSMNELGWIDLPARERKATMTGLDGTSYEGIAARPPERIYITKVEFSNSAPAVLHCADGRKINVVLHGDAASPHDSTTHGATIVIEVDDPDIALMDPQELRQLITLNPAACWRQHWNDAEILEEANSQARDTAIEHLALAPDDLELPSDMPAELKSETVLHYAVKHILKEAGELHTPEAVVYAEAFSEIDHHHRTWRLPEQRLRLSNVEMEKRLGLTRPDLVCQAVDTSNGPSYPVLCIEVTVSNRISEERRNRIQKVGMPAIEIDLSRLQGRITRDKLKQLVVNSSQLKQWIFNPVLRDRSMELDKEVRDLASAEDDALQEQREKLERIKAIPRRQIVDLYIESAYRYFLLFQDTEGSWPAQNSSQFIAVVKAKQQLCEHARLLAAKGFPGADENDFLNPRGLLEGLLSLKFDRGLSRKLNTGFEVLNVLMSEGKGITHELTPIYLAAAKVFDVPMTSEQQAIFGEWSKAARHRIATIKHSYVRNSKYDALIGTLFPELIDALVRTTSRHLATVYEKHQPRTQGISARASSPLKTSKQLSYTVPQWLQNPMFFSGAELQNWIEQNPESAKTLGIQTSEKNRDA
ncbi:hypothetical protein ACDW_45480 (plasmid) [Acidovorax sp. DW039]|uniref:hypothetical protein n=1 Tax=Acidovorax sp. DW039 TaxID=3095606 RepID=UPI003087E5F3|nr:hypothetical protein ACDW_45480 [Acidovorax sp. DW039]